LREFPEIVFDDQTAANRRGRWREWFAARIGPVFDGRLIFEVGCFNAEYLARIAAKHPQTAFVGLDWKFKAMFEGASRVAEMGLRNVALLRGRGQDIGRILAEGEVDEIWVFHPDPCDRDVELKNRLISESFLKNAHEVLRDENSVLALKTDHPGYYQWVLALFGLPEPAWFKAAREGRGDRGGPRVRAKDLVGAEGLPAASDAIRRGFDVAMNSADFWNDTAALTHTNKRCFAGEATQFEKRFIEKRLPIYYFEMRKRMASCATTKTARPLPSETERERTR
jgi:tRNA G46 methylase TrmB